MNTKNIILELSRMRQMMGLDSTSFKPILFEDETPNKKLILEGKVTQRLARGIKDFFTDNSSKIGDAIDRGGQKFAKWFDVELPQQTFNKIMNAVDSGDFTKLTDYEMKIIINTLKRDAIFLQKNYNEFLTILGNKGISEKQFMDALDVDVSRGMPVEDAIKRASGGDNDVFYDLFSNKIKSNFYGTQRGIHTPNSKVVRNIEDAADETFSVISDTELRKPLQLDGDFGVHDFQDWLDTNKPGWMGDGKSLNKGPGYGKYGPKTQEAFQKFQNEYTNFFERNAQDLASFNSKQKIKEFLSWARNKGKIDNKQYSKMLNDLNDKGYVTDEINSQIMAFKKDFEAFRGVDHNLDVSLVKIKTGKISASDGGWWDSTFSFLHPATRITFRNRLRKIVYMMYKKFSELWLGKQKIVDELCSKLLSLAEKRTLTKSSSEDLIRDITLTLASMRKSEEDVFESFLVDFRKVMKTSGVPDDKADDVIRDIKQKTAVKDLFTNTEYKPSDSYIGDLFEHSSWVNYWKEMKSMGKSGSEFIRGIWSSFERTLMFLLTGHIRTVDEVFEYILKRGVVKGLASYVAVCYFMKLLIAPVMYSVFVGFYEFFTSFFSSEDKGNFFTPFWKAFCDYYSKNVANGTLAGWSPWTFVYGKLSRVTNGTAHKETVNEIKQEIIKEMVNKLGLEQARAEEIANTIINENDEIDEKKLADLLLSAKEGLQEPNATPEGLEKYLKVFGRSPLRNPQNNEIIFDAINKVGFDDKLNAYYYDYGKDKVHWTPKFGGTGEGGKYTYSDWEKDVKQQQPSSDIFDNQSQSGPPFEGGGQGVDINQSATKN